MKRYLIGILLSPFFMGFMAPEVVAAQPASDTAAINALFRKADKVLNPDSAIVLFNEMLRESIKADYADGAFKALMTIGIKYFEKEDYEQERSYSMEASKWAKKTSHPDALAWSYGNVGDAYFNEGDYIRASEYFYKALDELKKIPPEPTHTAANIYNSLGQVNIRLGQPDIAMAFYNEAEVIAKKGKLYYQLAGTYLCKGEYFTSIHQADSARKYFSEVMDIGKKIGKIDLVALANSKLGKAYIETGEYGKAVVYLKTAIAIAKDKFPYIVIDASYSLGDAWYHLGSYKEAEAILESALREMIAHNFKDDYIRCYSKLIDVYKATGQFKKAVADMDTVATLKDSLVSVEKAKMINQMDIKYKLVDKDKQIAQGQLLIEQQNSKIERKNLWMLGIGGGVMVLALIALGLYRNSLHQQRLQAEHIKSLEQENKIGVLKAVVQGEDNERSRIARELHDGLGGMLSAAMMRFSAMRHDNEAVTSIPAYSEAMGILGEIGDEIRKTAHNLMPDVLLKQNLPDAVLAFCNTIREGRTLIIDFQSYGEFDKLAEDFKLNVYRIVQELLKNITQHAHATHALVQLVMNEQIMTVTVEDNGIGFNTNEVKDGIGLYNLRTRVRNLDGQIAIGSEAGKGTSVFIEFELPRNP